MSRSKFRGRAAATAHAAPTLMDRVLLGAFAIVAFAAAILVRNDTETSTLALVLAALAGVLSILAILLPYLTGLSGSFGGVSFTLNLVAARPDGLTRPLNEFSGQTDPATGKVKYVSNRTGFSEVVRGRAIDYAVIHLGSGDQWLASRLLIFTVVMRQLRKVRCIVLVAAASSGAEERLIGIVAPDDLWRSLAMEYPWLEAQLFRAWEQVSHIAGPLITLQAR